MSRGLAKILVVEDEAVVLHTLELILKHGGFEVRGARNGTEALSTALTFAPDILLCDINLPDTNGISVSLDLKKALPRCRIVLLSGEISSAELLEDAKQKGYQFEVLAKPTDPEVLLRILGAGERGPRAVTGIHRVK
jgi:CheY-like chemotaxis protein